MDSENISVKKFNMKVNGKMIYKMGLGLRRGRMEVHIQESLKQVKKLEKENLYIMMGVIMLEVFLIIIFTEKENIYGQMGGNMKEIGSIIKLMEMVFLNGVMGENIPVNIKMTKKKDMEFLNGEMEKNIRDFGKMENKMGKEKYMI